MGPAWGLRGACVGPAWGLRGACVGPAWGLRGACVGLAWGLRGACVVSAWCLRGACVVVRPASAACFFVLCSHNVSYPEQGVRNAGGEGRKGHTHMQYSKHVPFIHIMFHSGTRTTLDGMLDISHAR